MKLTITTITGDFFNLDVAEDMEVENLRALCEFESNVPTSQMILLFNGQPLNDLKKKILDYGIKDSDVILLNRLQTQQPRAAGGARGSGLDGLDFGRIQVPSAGNSGPRQPPPPPPAAQNDPATLRDMLLISPHELSILKERNPPLAEALLSGSLDKFTEVLQKQQRERAQREAEQIQLLNADPFDMDAQQKIAEQIRLKNVESNMEAAMEFAPESFGQVVMLYIDCKVNGHKVKAFVDSGAQMTIMSQQCAERCEIKRLVDTRWAGIAKGVGTQRIIGRVHLCQIQIEKDFLQTAFSILEDQPMDMLLGLDMLKRHQCILDLKENCLVIGTTGTRTRFLGEGDVPEFARLNRDPSTGDVTDEDKQLAEAMNQSARSAAGQAALQRSQPSSSSAQTSSSTTSAAATPSPFPEAAIATIMANGFSRQQAIEELRAAGGNVDQAIVSLIAKSFSLPSS